ncbi:MAG: hypothetical protein CSA89_00165 [Bacteroidales bacterium]|nr:MAG: hypothetical protein CSA89_00165 [Bacteroidales bacterium]
MANSLLEDTIATIDGNRVLVAPLNWGIGHATRCVPMIKALLEADKDVIIAADGYPLQLLKRQFPQLLAIEFSWAKVHYSKSSSQFMSMLYQTPKFIYSIIKEHFALKKIVEQYNIDVVISDNRFGLWCKKRLSIYITHQISVKTGTKNTFLDKLLYRIHKVIIERYDECWIPDFEDDSDNLSGDLSHKYPLPKNAKFIGILSRFG